MPAPTSRPTSRFKTNFEKGFEQYLRTHYAEHYRRIPAGRKSARWALFTYPLSLLGAFGLPVAGITVVASLLYSQNPSWFANVLTPESAAVVMPLLYGTTAGAAIIGLFFGISLGLSNARNLIFDSERNELQVRQTYYLRRLTRSKKQKKQQKNLNGAMARVQRDYATSATSLSQPTSPRAASPGNLGIPTPPRFTREQDINVAHEAE